MIHLFARPFAGACAAASAAAVRSAFRLAPPGVRPFSREVLDACHPPQPTAPRGLAQAAAARRAAGLVNVDVRELGFTDSAGLVRFFHQLDDESFAVRFPRDNSTRDSQAERLIRAAGGHLRAFVARDRLGRIVGLVDYEPLNHGCGLDEDICMVNVVVAGHARRRGLGTGLMREAMVRARSEGFKTLIATVSRSNQPMLRILRELGASEGGADRLARDHCTYVIDVTRV